MRPDIVLLEVNLPGMNGVDTAYEIRRILPATKIVFLALHHSPAIVRRARLLGHAFVSKSQVGTELIPALMCLANNQSNRAVRKPKSYRIRLMCEHADYDKWVIKECDGLSLQDVANRLWEFDCPIHGPQSRLPFEVELEKDVADFQEGRASSFFF